MANQLYQGSNPLATTCPPVVDNLTSTSSTDALSAKQGKVLNDKFKKVLVGGNYLGGALNNGNIIISVALSDKNFTTATLSKSSNVSCTIYGSISATATTCDVILSQINNGILSLGFTPNVTLGNYTALAKGFWFQLNELIEVTLS